MKQYRYIDPTVINNALSVTYENLVDLFIRGMDELVECNILYPGNEEDLEILQEYSSTIQTMFTSVALKRLLLNLFTEVPHNENCTREYIRHKMSEYWELARGTHEDDKLLYDWCQHLDFLHDTHTRVDYSYQLLKTNALVFFTEAMFVQLIHEYMLNQQ